MKFRQHEFTRAFFCGTESSGLCVPRGIFCLPLWNFCEEGTFHESRAATGIEKHVNFCDMFRSGTNVIGNALATSVISKWEGELLPEGVKEEE